MGEIAYWPHLDDTEHGTLIMLYISGRQTISDKTVATDCLPEAASCSACQKFHHFYKTRNLTSVFTKAHLFSIS